MAPGIDSPRTYRMGTPALTGLPLRMQCAHGPLGGALAVLGADMGTSSCLTYGVSIVFALVTSVAGYYDLHTREVPNWLTLPALGFALGWCVVRTAWGSQPAARLVWCLLGFGIIQAAWLWGGFGGADAKLFGALWLLWPTVAWLVMWLASLILGYAAYRITSSGRRPLPALGPGAMGAWLYIIYLSITLPVSGGLA